MRCANNLKQLGLALHAYHDAHDRLPPGFTRAADAYRDLGWPARVLPFAGHDALWDAVRRAFGNDPDTNRFYGHPPHAVLTATPVVLLSCPSDGRLPGPNLVGTVAFAHTSYLGVHGTDQTRQDGLLYPDSRTALVAVTDGTSQTLLPGERPPPGFELGWWYRGWGQGRTGSAETLLGARERNTTRPACGGGPYPFATGRPDELCDAFHFWSPHPGGANFLLADGSVRLLAYAADAVLPALATRAGGDAAAVPD